MRTFCRLFGLWLVVWPATSGATVTLTTLSEPVLADLTATEVDGGAPPATGQAAARLEAATLGLRLDGEQLVLGRVEQADLPVGDGRSLLVGGFELGYRRDLAVGPHLMPFASA